MMKPGILKCGSLLISIVLSALTVSLLGSAGRAADLCKDKSRVTINGTIIERSSFFKQQENRQYTRLALAYPTTPCVVTLVYVPAAMAPPECVYNRRIEATGYVTDLGPLSDILLNADSIRCE